MIGQICKSVAAYLTSTTTLDFTALPSAGPNLAIAADGTLVSSALSAGSLGALIDGNASTSCTLSSASPSYVGVTWTAARDVAALRIKTSGAVASVSVDTYDGATWTTVDTITIASSTAATYRLSPAAAGVYGVRIAKSAASFGVYDFTVLADGRLEPRPLAWPSTVTVLHADSNLSQASAPLVTVHAVEEVAADDGIGDFSVLQDTTVFVGVHGTTEDQVQLLGRWAEMVLLNAAVTDEAGTYRTGIPLALSQSPMTKTATGNWWSSGQPGWYAGTTVTVTVDGATVTPTTKDYVQGRVELGSAPLSTADVRVSVRVGVWECDVERVVRADVETLAQIPFRHALYYALRSPLHSRSSTGLLV